MWLKLARNPNTEHMREACKIHRQYIRHRLFYSRFHDGGFRASGRWLMPVCSCFPWWPLFFSPLLVFSASFFFLLLSRPLYNDSHDWFQFWWFKKHNITHNANKGSLTMEFCFSQKERLLSLSFLFYTFRKQKCKLDFPCFVSDIWLTVNYPCRWYLDCSFASLLSFEVNPRYRCASDWLMLWVWRVNRSFALVKPRWMFSFCTWNGQLWEAYIRRREDRLIIPIELLYSNVRLVRAP